MITTHPVPTDPAAVPAQVRRVRIHDLRHAAASFMLLQGVDMRVVMGTLGHSRLATTSDLYTHLLEPVQRAAADRMDDPLRQVNPWSRSLITAVAVSVAVRDAKEDPPEPGQLL
jgi:hypothetical protein